MARRSLQASLEGIRIAKQAFERKGWTQDYLARQSGIQTRQPIWKFFSGKPVDRHIFAEICFQLGLEFEEIVDLPREVKETANHSSTSTTNSTIETLVKKVRRQRYERIQKQCGNLHLADVARLININELFVPLEILEDITSQTWLPMAQLQGLSAPPAELTDFGQQFRSKTSVVEAVQKYSKLMMLGKPGSGKTSCLKYLAIHCNQGEFQPRHIPVYLQLKCFVEDAQDEGNYSLLDYLHQEFALTGIHTKEVEMLLSEGKVLLLLDGLDEVPLAQRDDAIRQIRKLADRFYKNQIIITCRLAALEYRFQGFTEVEIADFSPSQVESFAHQWFINVAKHEPELGSQQAKLFLAQLDLPTNKSIRELALTPLLLNQICLVFQAQGQLAPQCSYLYQHGLDLLLMRWDEIRGIKREKAYPNLSLPHTLEILSLIASDTFEAEEYFFSDLKIKRFIGEYLHNLPEVTIDTLILPFDSGIILKEIESQHGLLVERARGIYSFSHLVLQKYFTARAIATSQDNQKLAYLAQQITQKRWHEVLILTAQILPDANYFLQLLKQQTAQLIQQDQQIQSFLDSVNHKAYTITSTYQPEAVRAFYFTLGLPIQHSLSCNFNLASTLDNSLTNELEADLKLDLALIKILNFTLQITPPLANRQIRELQTALSSLNLELNQEQLSFKKLLQDLKNRLPELSQTNDEITQWWQNNGSQWLEQLRSILINQRQIGYDWNFDPQQLQLLEQYGYASQVCLDCLTSNCHATMETKTKLRENFFLSEKYSVDKYTLNGNGKYLVEITN